MTVTLLGERLRAQAQAQAKNAALARLVEFGTSTNLPESANTEGYVTVKCGNFPKAMARVPSRELT